MPVRGEKLIIDITYYFSHLYAYFSKHTLQIISVQPQILPLDFGEESFNFGDPVSLKCSLHKGDLPVNLSWLHNNVSIGYNDGIIISKVGTRTSVVTIDAVIDEHRGVYTCIAENKAGVARAYAQLNVNGISDKYYIFCYFNPFCYLYHWNI